MIAGGQSWEFGGIFFVISEDEVDPGSNFDFYRSNVCTVYVT